MDVWRTVWPYIAGLLPTLGLLWLFYVIMKNMVQGDRMERAAIRRLDEEAAKKDGPISRN